MVKRGKKPRGITESNPFLLRTPPNISILGADLTTIILSHLNAKGWAVTKRVCKKWNELSQASLAEATDNGRQPFTAREELRDAVRMHLGMELAPPFLGEDIFNQDHSEEDAKDTARVYGSIMAEWDVSLARNFDRIFVKTKLGTIGCIGSWDVSSATTMDSMFYKAKIFKQDLSGWDTSKVTNMDYMFGFADSYKDNIRPGDIDPHRSVVIRCYHDFHQDLSNWNTSNVTTMKGMFKNCKAFSQDLTRWDTSKVRDMQSMFEECGFNGDISSWNTSSVINMKSMFSLANEFNRDISSWNTGNVTNMERMFFWATSFNQDISDWDTRRVTNMYRMFYEARSFNLLSVDGWKTSLVGKGLRLHDN